MRRHLAVSPERQRSILNTEVSSTELIRDGRADKAQVSTVGNPATLAALKVILLRATEDRQWDMEAHLRAQEGMVEASRDRTSSNGSSNSSSHSHRARTLATTAVSAVTRARSILGSHKKRRVVMPAKFGGI